MKTLTLNELKDIYQAVGEREGWDFSKLKREKEPLPWDYEDILKKYLKKSDRVLDIGTGGGELCITLAPFFNEGVGIDHSKERLGTARKKLPPNLKKKVSYLFMDAQRLDFKNETIDVVINRHAPIFADEIARVLKPGGYFISQQVGGENSENIFKTFGWPPSGEYWKGFWAKKGFKPRNIENADKDFRKLGFQILSRQSAKTRYWFKDIPSLIFWLKSVPLPEKFDLKKHWKIVNKFIQMYSTSKGIETNEHRELLVVRKPD
jgi:SAM-dependent methyltransferase